MQTDCYWQTEESKQTRKLSDRQTERMTVRRILIDRQNSSQTFAFVNEQKLFQKSYQLRIEFLGIPEICYRYLFKENVILKYEYLENPMMRKISLIMFVLT